jgi:hypothetical protein
MPEWFKGPYYVLEKVDSLETKPRPGRGEIIAHKSGAVILRCPQCGALQFGRAVILNSPATPTLDRPLQCGSGHCKKCGVWFIIRNGEALPAEAPERKERVLPEKLRKAGVRYVPRLKTE